MRKSIPVAIVGIATVTVVVTLLVNKLPGKRLEVKTYFQDAQGLRASAPVRLAGVEIGFVKSVRAVPSLRENPAEVVMVLNDQKDLKIPSDSTVSLGTQGVLGPTFAEINVRNASGPPLESGSVLKAEATEILGPQQLLDRLQEIVQHKPCESPDQEATSRVSPKESDSRRKKPPQQIR